jgi:transcription initiation factor TFIID TATA-box-binding protein
MSELKIENIVFSALLAEKFDLQYLSEKIVDSKYNLDEFSGLILDYNDPKCAVFLFPNGKISCTGLRNTDDIETIINIIIKDIEEYKVKIFDDIHFDIDNIIASSNLEKNINLDIIKDQSIFEMVEYNKNDFSGLIFNIIDPKIDVIIFNSGKIIFMGSKDIEEIKKALRIVKDNFVKIGVI